MLGRDRLIQIDAVVKRPAKRRIFNDGNTVLLGDLAHAEGDRIDALGDQHRRLHLLVFVLEGNRVMGRVRDHHVGIGHGGHHAPARPFRADLAQARLDHRIALGLLVLLLEFLLRHAKLFHVLLLLIEKVEDRDHRHDRKDADKHADRQALQHPHELRDAQRGDVEHDLALRPQEQHHDRTDDGDLGHALGEFHQRAAREQALQALDQRQFLQLGRDRFGREHQAVLNDAGCEGRQQHHDHRRQHRQPELAHGLEQDIAQLPAVEPDAMGPLHETVQAVRDPLGERFAENADEERGRQDHEPMGDLLGLRDLALLARLIEPSLCRFLCFLRIVLIVFGHGPSDRRGNPPPGAPFPASKSRRTAAGCPGSCR